MKGFAETLESLKNEGYILAVATSKPEGMQKGLRTKFDFAKYFCRDLRGYDGWLSDPEGGCDPVCVG